MTDEKRPLGKILLQRKLISQQDLDAALRTQKRTPSRPIGAVLVDEGTVDEVDALRALSEQHGVPGIDLTQVAIVLEHLDVVPREVAESHQILPVLMRGDRIFLAMHQPHDKRVIDELEFVTGKKVYPYVAVTSTLVRTIGAAYDAKDRGERHYLGPRVPPETLKQLGIAAAPASPPSAPAPPAPAAKKPPVKPPLPPRAAAAAPPAPPPPRASYPTQPPKPAVVVDEATETAARGVEVSVADFGAVGDDVSSVMNLPEELRTGAQKAAGVAAASGGKLVLVVDDEEEIRKMLTRLLTTRGYRVLEADRGLLALRLVKDHVPDLIILDAMLPELHGFDIARRIKGSAKYGRIPIIMVSAVYRGWRIAEDLKNSYGIEEYIEKPFRIADVLETVQRLLSKERAAPGGESAGAEARDPDQISAEASKALEEGIAAYKAGQIDAAIEHLKRGIGIDPLSYRLHFHLALLFGKKGQIYEGIQELERAIDLNPKHFPALKNLAVLYEKAGFKNKAVEMWERCVAAAPDEATRASIKEHLVKLI